MKKLIIAIILLLPSYGFASEIEDIEQHKIPDSVFIEFIKTQNDRISKAKALEIVRAIKYYAPRYFKNETRSIYNEGLTWVFAMIAQESSFRNVNGDEGVSIGYMQVQTLTCMEARRYNGIKVNLNLHALWPNIHCGMAEIHRLHNNTQSDWRLTVKAYNGGLGAALRPLKWKTSNRQTDKHFALVSKRRAKLLKYIYER